MVLSLEWSLQTLAPISMETAESGKSTQQQEERLNEQSGYLWSCLPSSPVFISSGLLPEGAAHGQGGLPKLIEAIKTILLLRLPTQMNLNCSETSLKPTTLNVLV